MNFDNNFNEIKFISEHPALKTALLEVMSFDLSKRNNLSMINFQIDNLISDSCPSYYRFFEDKYIIIIDYYFEWIKFGIKRGQIFDNNWIENAIRLPFEQVQEFKSFLTTPNLEELINFI